MRSKSSSTPSLAALRATYPTRLAVITPAPKSLEPPEAALWQAILARTKLTEPAHLDMLEQALIARGTARKHQQIAEDEGPMVRDRFDQLKPHPLFSTASKYRRDYLAYLRALGLDLFEIERS